jgi:MFS family permease
MDSVFIKTFLSKNQKNDQVNLSENVSEKFLYSSSLNQLNLSKKAIRNSLKASTLDGIFAAIFSLTSGGILLSNFLVELDASPAIFGLLASIPMLANLTQPLGAYLSEQTTSRRLFSQRIYGISRLLWLIVVIGIFLASWELITSQQLTFLTLLIACISHLCGSLGSASWMSWLAAIVPRKLRGRYFSLRNSAASLTNLLCIPIGGFAVSYLFGGSIQGYGLVLCVGILCGLVSLGCQYFKIDVNPQLINTDRGEIAPNNQNITSQQSLPEQSPIQSARFLGLINYNNVHKSNFWVFLLYFSLWMLSFHLCDPFVNLYLLKTLNINVGWVTIYSSLEAGANLLMVLLWGKLADQIGNRLILICVGIIVAITPLLWFAIGNSDLDIWLWIPIVHIFMGGTRAGIDLCNNNMQIAITPARNQSIYFAIAAAIGGVMGALGTSIGGFIAQSPQFGGLLGLFTLSCLCRLIALIPLVFVQDREVGK